MPSEFLSTIDFLRRAKDGNVGVRKYLVVEEKQVDDENLVIEFVNSTPLEDRYHDTIDQDGWILDSYLKNPVVLWAHDYTVPPVAKSLAVWIEDGKLKSRDQFTPRDLYPFGYMVYELYKNGFLHAKSVGFVPLDWEPNGEGGVFYKKQELLEHSCVPVPANPEALIAAKGVGIDLSPLKEWAEKILDLSELQEERDFAKRLETVYFHITPRIFAVPAIEKAVHKPEGGGWDETENSWRYRVRDPELFIDDSFRTKRITEGVSVVFGKLKEDGPEGPMTVQSIVFDKDVFATREEAERWLEEHQDLTKSVAFEIEKVIEKEGRVLSEKNRSLISNCIAQMKEAIQALEDLLQATEPPEKEVSTDISLDDLLINLDEPPEPANEDSLGAELDVDAVVSLIKQAVREELNKARGRIA